jgi:flagellar basal-body rod protein FlgG
MLRGYYTAASGLVTQEKRLNMYASNIANASTGGYKKDNMISGTFGEHLAVRMNAYQNTPHHPIGPGVYMQIIDEKYTDYTQGAFDFTNRPMDVAIKGDGFFVIAKEDGEYLTRDGQFSLDDEGYLILPGFGRVMGENGELEIGTSGFSVDEDGNVFVLPYGSEEDEEPELLDRLLIVVPEEGAQFDKARDSLYIASAYVQVDGTQPQWYVENGVVGLMTDADGNTVESGETSILFGTVERSNINMAEEMTRVIASQRSLQSNSQILKMYDEMAQQITSQISRVQ